MINTPSVTARLSDPTEAHKKALDNFSFDLRCAAPGIIQSFNPTKQTVEVKLCIKEKISIDGKPFELIEVPILGDVPIVLPKAGNFILTMPIKAGDECLVIFADNCIDAWWESGKVSSPMERRRHDLSDGFAILGTWSQPNVISGYSTDSAVLRNLNNDSYVEVKDTQINIVTSSKVQVTAENVQVDASDVKINSQSATVTASTTTINSSSATINSSGSAVISGGAINITGSSALDITGSGGITSIDGKNFLHHKHLGVQMGSDTSGEMS